MLAIRAELGCIADSDWDPVSLRTEKDGSTGGTGADADEARIPSLCVSVMEKVSSSIVRSEGKKRSEKKQEQNRKKRGREEMQEARERETEERQKKETDTEATAKREDEAKQKHEQKTLTKKNRKIPERKLRAWKYGLLSFKTLTMFPTGEHTCRKREHSTVS